MTNNMPILLLFSTSSFFLLVHLVSPLSDTCSYNLCGRGEPAVQFPFRLKQYQPDERCVYPGFDLTCDVQNRTTLRLPTSGEFIVDTIDYIDQVLWLRDPDDCLPKRLQNFNPSGSNWTVQRYTSFTLFKCPKVRSVPSMLPRVACLDGHEYYVVAVAVDDLSQDMNLLSQLRCGDNWTIQIPTVNSTFASPYYAIEFSNTFGLTWARPSCGSCAAGGGTCWFEGKNGLETKCTYPKYDVRAVVGAMLVLSHAFELPEVLADGSMPL
ncbi:putative RING-H2 finger protein ATL21A [Rhodamnia argentea]|uniref:RING-type E3 ubiquitin transferase n=1 Tax=Rhodamnia argentea TaxID=178133 RepID=A0ABM3HXS5_9MYRT|nr:putative RING-H2 finger protein ATL21A [Rhodamnia argentea]